MSCPRRRYFKVNVKNKEGSKRKTRHNETKQIIYKRKQVVKGDKMSLPESVNMFMCIYIYIYIYIYLFIYVYIYVYMHYCILYHSYVYIYIYIFYWVLPESWPNRATPDSYYMSIILYPILLYYYS